MKKEKSMLPRIGIKLAAVLLLLSFWYILAGTALRELVDYNDVVHNKALSVRICDASYYEGQYGNLREFLQIEDLEGPDFDLYWEAVDGYEDYQMYRQYTKAYAAGMEEAKEAAESYRRKVLKNAENCIFDRNRKQLETYAEAVRKSL